MKKCPCGSEKTYAACCAPFIAGEQLPATPEALMRSRYTAYTQANIDYISATMAGKAAAGFDREDATRWARQVKWLGLTVLAAPAVAIGTAMGIVEFVARYQLSGKIHYLREKSEFQWLNGRWYYVGSIAHKET